MMTDRRTAAIEALTGHPIEVLHDDHGLVFLEATLRHGAAERIVDLVAETLVPSVDELAEILDKAAYEWPRDVTKGFELTGRLARAVRAAILETDGTPDVPYCCFSGCFEAALVMVYADSSDLYDYTYACEEHVGQMLGSTTNDDVRVWTLHLLPEPSEHLLTMPPELRAAILETETP